MTNEERYRSNLVTFYNRKWDVVYTVRQSLINGRCREVILAVRDEFRCPLPPLGGDRCREVKIKTEYRDCLPGPKRWTPVERWPLVEVRPYLSLSTENCWFSI